MRNNFLNIIVPLTRVMAPLTLIGAFALSCVQLDLKTADDTSDETAIAFSVDWGEKENTSRPDSVYIAMNKISDNIRYSYSTDAAGAFFLTDEDTTGVHREYAVYGNYVILAYYCDRTDYSLSGPQRFMKDKTLSVRDFTATVNDLPAEELDDFRGGSKVDFNSAYRFIRTPGPVWTASLKGVVSDTRENVYRLTMQPMQQKITVAVKIAAEEDVRIISVTAELSGVPASFALLTGEVSEKDIARVIFSMSRSEYGYEGTVAVPGLLPSENSSLRTGPGILRLSVTAARGDETRILYPAINIGDKIVSASLMTSVPGSDGRRIAKREARLEIGDELRIGAENFSSEGGGDGVEAWFDSGVIDVEI